MSISLAATYTALSPGLQSSFQAYGGSTPYVYSVVPAGVGGSINASTGIYTAPSPPAGRTTVVGSDIVKVVDAAAASTSLAVVVGPPITLICDIIQTQMGLSPGQVYVFDQKVIIPTDSQLYIAVSDLNPKPFGQSCTMDANGNQVQSVNMFSQYQIDIWSRDTSARDRKEEVPLALGSIYSQQQQAACSFSIGRIPSVFRNLSKVDGAAIPYRYSIDVNVTYFAQKSLPAPYYSSFPTPVVAAVQQY